MATREKHERPALLDVPAAAAHLGVGERMIRRLAAERRVPFHKVGRHIRFATVDLDAYLMAGRVEATGQDRAAR